VRPPLARRLSSATRAYDCAVTWTDWIRDGREVEPSLYAADFGRLGDQLVRLLDAGARIFHFDIGDGHFVPPVTIGPVVLRSIAQVVHERGGVFDCHLMVTDPAHHFEEIARSGGDSVTFHVEAADDPAGVAAKARDLGLAVGVAFNPGTSPEDAAAAAEAADAELVLCMSIWPGYSGQPFMPEALPRVERLAGLVSCPIQVDGGVGEDNIEHVSTAGARLFVAGSAIFADADPAAAHARLAALVGP
jgi:ribulose-phosphate 3-epimerase